MEVQVVHKVLKANDDLAAMVRAKFEEYGIVGLNLISAPGSGKTSLIETTLSHLKAEFRFGVIEGDPDTTRDAERVAKFGVPVTQINTAGGCHLEANLVWRTLDNFNLHNLQIIIIENVGNLVCPVGFDLGETKRIAVVSVPEGHDKPIKYPKLFRTADLTILNKIDLLPYIDFDEAQFTADIKALNPDMRIIRMSCRTGEGVEEWLAWIKGLVV
ncbi:MAG: hydrogenase accessory protein HypB [Gemmatimonadetes bacterium]|nr:MAG: hydrogenase accessory protein HypB [Gemmatimonadota bacterium]